MTRSPVKSIARFAACALFAFAVAHPASTQQDGNVASYVVSVGGINVANVDIRLGLEAQSYQLDVSADVAGLAQVVAQGSGVANSGGRIGPEGLSSERFFLETRSQGERFSVEAHYSDGNTTHYGVSPPLDERTGRVPVTDSHRRGVNDPVAAFILRGNGLDPSLCNRQMRIFTGIERFDLNLRYADTQQATSTRTGYQGPVVLCQMDYRPVSGHFTTSEITNYLIENQRMLVWFSPLADTDYFIPYRVIIGTRFGDLSMVLTSID